MPLMCGQCYEWYLGVANRESFLPEEGYFCPVAQKHVKLHTGACDTGFRQPTMSERTRDLGRVASKFTASYRQAIDQGIARRLAEEQATSEDVSSETSSEVSHE